MNPLRNGKVGAGGTVGGAEDTCVRRENATVKLYSDTLTAATVEEQVGGALCDGGEPA